MCRLLTGSHHSTWPCLWRLTKNIMSPPLAFCSVVWICFWGSHVVWICSLRELSSSIVGYTNCGSSLAWIRSEKVIIWESGLCWEFGGFKRYFVYKPLRNYSKHTIMRLSWQTSLTSCQQPPWKHPPTWVKLDRRTCDSDQAGGLCNAVFPNLFSGDPFFLNYTPSCPNS